MGVLHNRVSQTLLKQKVKDETFVRLTVSFYDYFPITSPAAFRDELYQSLFPLDVLGRIYLAEEGINAQVSLPEHQLANFKEALNKFEGLSHLRLNRAIDDDGRSFWVLKIKVRNKIVADGITDPNFSMVNKGRYLNATAFNTLAEQPDSIIVDMRNHYESEVGKFDGAFCPDADTFREELPLVIDHLQGQEDKKILMYCTGGIRCEKASAYFKHKGFKDVNHLQGGIIQYAKEVKEKGLESKFKGINFVFDERIGERITDDVLSECHQCGVACDTHVNCKNDDCHLLFIQCPACAQKMNGCCTPECLSIATLPLEEQRKLRKGRVKNGPECLAVYKSRLRPNLKEIIKNNLSLKNI